MILNSPRVSKDDLERRTGWAIKPEGACKGVVCVPFASDGEDVDMRALAGALGMPIVEDAGLFAVGPESGGRALTTAQAPDLELPDWKDEPFALRSLRGQKVLLLAWASW